MAEVGDFGEERVVATGGLHAAFDDMPGDHRPASRRNRLAPTEVRSGGAYDHPTRRSPGR